MKKSAFVLVALVVLASCEGFVTEINDFDITRAQEADLHLVVRGAQLNYMGTLESQLARTAGLWSGYFVGTSTVPKPIYDYDVTASSYSTLWNNVYAGTLINLRIAQAKASALGNRSTLGMCQVMEASLMATTAALWGDIPYDEAVNPELYPNPKYDNQVVVIDKLLVLLDSALVNLSSPESRMGDFLFTATSHAQWIATANSVKARLLLYREDYSGALQAALLGIQQPANDLRGKHATTSPGEFNQYYQFINGAFGGAGFHSSNTFIGGLLTPGYPGNRNHAKTTESSRISFYFTGTAVGNYVPNSTSSGIFAQGAAFPLHTAAETKLIAAECLIRTGDFANSLIKLNEHRANLRSLFPSGVYVDFVAADFAAAGIENPAGSLSANDALLREILEEKYVCLFGQVEAFSEIRRTGNILGLPPNKGSLMPERYLYPQTEINANSSTPSPIPGLYEKTTLFQ